MSWGVVPCAARNGEITGYMINYTTANDKSSNITMAQANTSNKIIAGLSPCIEYSFRVAAVNINGTGPFSQAMNKSAIALGTFSLVLLYQNT